MGVIPGVPERGQRAQVVVELWEKREGKQPRYYFFQYYMRLLVHRKYLILTDYKVLHLQNNGLRTQQSSKV